jgi:putative hydrolase of the HAD superfamily
MIWVLDLDDTLFLERDYVRSGFRAIDEWLRINQKIEGFYSFAWNSFEKGARANIIDRFLERQTLTEMRLLDQMILVYREHRPAITLLPDAERFLNRHQPNTLGLITDGRSKSQWAKIDALGLRDRIGEIIVTGDWGVQFWKPHPRAFMEVQKKHPHHSCLYIGDNPKKDFIAPMRLNWSPSIRIRRPASLHSGIATPLGCQEIETLDDIDNMSLDFQMNAFQK